VILQPSCAIRASVFLLVSLALGCEGASLLRSPYLQNVGPDRATILWTSSERVGAAVRYSQNGDLTGSAAAAVRPIPVSANSPAVYQYRVDLRNLEPSREYFYEIVADGRVITDDLRFRTAGPGAFRFLVFGDSGTGTDEQLKLAARMVQAENPSLVLHTGDLSQESGTPEQLDTNYLKVYSQLMGRAPFFPTPGNHDYYTDAGKPCFAIHAAPLSAVPAEDEGQYYSFDWGNVHFISLNSNLMEYASAADRMLQWLERDLSTQKNFWKVVYFHHTPYPTGHHASDPVSALMRVKVVPVLERHGVQVVFSGHEHSYQRTFPLRDAVPVETGGTVYVTTGGGGGVLHHIQPGKLHAIGKSVHHYISAEVRGAHMTLTVTGLGGETIDSVTLSAPTNPVVESVVNAGSYTPALASGSLIKIFGRDLAVGERTPPSPALELAGSTVTLDGHPLPLLYAAPHQITAQLPYGFTGRGTLRVNSRTAAEQIPVEVAPTAPAILQVLAGFRYFPAVWRTSTNSIATKSTPAQPGETVTIYVVGLGAVHGNIHAGDTAPSAPALVASHQVQVQIGGKTITPAFAGLTPSFIGLYQVNVVVPSDVPAGPVSLRVLAEKAASEPATLFIGPRAQ